MIWIIENFKEAYRHTISDKELYGGGDFMLYLSLGILLHKLAATNTKLQIVLMKPENKCIIQEDTPLVMEGKDINEILNKE